MTATISSSSSFFMNVSEGSHRDSIGRAFIEVALEIVDDLIRRLGLPEVCSRSPGSGELFHGDASFGICEDV